MTTAIIITICCLLLVSYLFELSSSRTKIPSVILLLALGWTAGYGLKLLHFQLMDLSSVLQFLGAIGLILIVLDGSLELELNKSKIPKIATSFWISLLPMIIMSFLLAFSFHFISGDPLKNCFINAIPFCIISSAIAIPSVQHLSETNKEFIIYESSLSDILGVVFFNFLIFNEAINAYSIISFGGDLIIMCLISLVATMLLGLILSKIDHHIKFVPIIVLIILIYEISKVYHLPALIFILLFGIIIGNIDKLKNQKWMQYFQPPVLNTEVFKFKEIVTEGSFLIRSLFFLVFGYLIKIEEIFNTEALLISIGIVSCIFIVRYLALKLLKIPVFPLLLIAPRGLITILLFYSISVAQSISIINRSIIIQVIVFSSLIMMIGLMTNKKQNSLN